MRERYHHRIEKVNIELLEMGAEVEYMLNRAMVALLDKDVVGASEVIAYDSIVDDKEVNIEDSCLNLIVTQQPMGSDLRRIVTILKIITDLERIADHAVNISRVTVENDGKDFIKPLVDIPIMFGLCKEMIKNSLNAFLNGDIGLAQSVIESDNDVDELYEGIYIELLGIISTNNSVRDRAIPLLLIGRYLERIADHSTNICERVIYMETGQRVE